MHPTGGRSEFLDERVILEQVDISDAHVWDALLSKWRPKKIVHLAAETGTAQSLTEASRHATANVLGTTRMLDALSRAGILPERIILASSRAVYGEGAWRDSVGELFYPKPRAHATLAKAQWDPTGPDGFPATSVPHEAAVVAPNPASIYGATKLTQEHILQAWCGAYSVPLSILRLQNVYGEGQSPYNPYTGIINVFHRLASSGQSIPVYEDGAIVRDFVHIDDVVQVISSILQSTDDQSHRFDVGTGTATTILEAANIIARLHGAPAPVICGKFRDGDVRSAVASTKAMSDQTGITAGVTFEQGAERVGRWLETRGYL